MINAPLLDIVDLSEDTQVFKFTLLAFGLLPHKFA